MIICDKCKKFGLEYISNHFYSPQDFIEGSLDAKIWIIGLNPKINENEFIDKTLEELRSFNPNQHPYFKDFKKVSAKLYNNWEGLESKIAHTDLVKCASTEFPPKNPKTSKKCGSKDIDEIISNCFENHLKKQILTYKPLLIICNGAFTSETIFTHFSPNDKSINSAKEVGMYETSFNDHNFIVVMSGFIGRIDDWSKRRLGVEIEKAINMLNIYL